MVHHFFNGDPAANVPVQHGANQVNAIFAHYIRNPKVSVHDLIDTVERVLLVDYGIEEDSKCPDILFLTAVWLPG